MNELSFKYCHLCKKIGEVNFKISEPIIACRSFSTTASPSLVGCVYRVGSLSWNILWSRSLTRCSCQKALPIAIGSASVLEHFWERYNAVRRRSSSSAGAQRIHYRQTLISQQNFMCCCNSMFQPYAYKVNPIT